MIEKEIPAERVIPLPTSITTRISWNPETTEMVGGSAEFMSLDLHEDKTTTPGESFRISFAEMEKEDIDAMYAVIKKYFELKHPSQVSKGDASEPESTTPEP